MKIGDRVKIVREGAKYMSQRHELVGLLGTVKYIDDYVEFPITVAIDKIGSLGFLNSELEVIE